MAGRRLNQHGKQTSPMDWCLRSKCWVQRDLLTLRSSPAGKNLRVGKLWTLTVSISLAVESILATMMSALSLYFSPSFSQIGVSCLQCPHQGASGDKRLESAWSEIRIGRSMQRKIGVKPTKIYASHISATFTSCMHVSYNAI